MTLAAGAAAAAGLTISARWREKKIPTRTCTLVSAWTSGHRPSRWGFFGHLFSNGSIMFVCVTAVQPSVGENTRRAVCLSDAAAVDLGKHARAFACTSSWWNAAVRRSRPSVGFSSRRGAVRASYNENCSENGRDPRHTCCGGGGEGYSSRSPLLSRHSARCPVYWSFVAVESSAVWSLAMGSARVLPLRPCFFATRE